VCLLAALQLWLRPLLPVDETRYLSVAWEMWQRHDFLVPHLNGETYSHKPPLLFWLIHAVWSLSGVSELAARLLPVALSLLVLFLSASLADRLWPGHGSVIRPLVPWLLLGGLFWNNFFSLVQFDLLLVLAAVVAWRGVLVALHNPLHGWALVAAGIGFGVLGKGPVILVPVLPAMLFAPWWARECRPDSWWNWYLGAGVAVLAGAAIALAWAVPAGMAGGAAYREAIFWGQSAGRLVSSFAHRSPWWSYLLWLPLMWLPWLIWPQLWQAARRTRSWDTGIRFCVAVIIPALVVYSAISAKQGKYLLPLFPLIGLLLARFLTDAANGVQRYRLKFIGLVLLVSGALLMALRSMPQLPLGLQQVQLMWGLALLVWGVLFFRLELQLAAAVRGAALGGLLWTTTLYLALVPVLSPRFQLGAMSSALAQLQTSGHELAYLGRYHGQFHFLGRLERRVEPLTRRGQLQSWLADNPDGYVLVNYKTPLPNVPDSLLAQPYRGGSLVLWPAAQFRDQPHRLDALQGNA
jgi:4-amino-4-deoxy-L-arabinose transferase-like glycosyltransferase